MSSHPALPASAASRPNLTIRGGNGQATGGLAVDSNLGWKGPEKYVATVRQIYDLWADPQERYDIFMNNLPEQIMSSCDRAQFLLNS